MTGDNDALNPITPAMQGHRNADDMGMPPSIASDALAYGQPRCIAAGCNEPLALPSQSGLYYCEKHMMEAPCLFSVNSYNVGFVLQYLLKENAKQRRAIEDLSWKVAHASGRSFS